VESISKANARQPAIQRPCNTQSIRIQFNIFKGLEITSHNSYRTTDLVKAFHTDCLIYLMEQYGLFMLYLSKKLTYSYVTRRMRRFIQRCTLYCCLYVRVLCV